MDSPRRSSREQFREKEDEGDRKNDGPTTSVSGQGRTLPQPRGLCTIVRGGDSWCGVQHGSAPTTLARVKGPRQGKARFLKSNYIRLGTAEFHKALR